jgi:hypothetical protein
MHSTFLHKVASTERLSQGASMVSLGFAEILCVQIIYLVKPNHRARVIEHLYNN